MMTATLVLTLMGFTLGALLAMASRLFNVAEENALVDEIEALLPQSQCGQCGMPGCHSAAEAIANSEAAITCCPPGGQALVQSLADLLGIDSSTVGEAPTPVIARITASLCTGCTRCYKVCPTDAIVGANKQIHSVLQEACTGCGKCVEACPEDCVELLPEAATLHNWYSSKPTLV